MIIPIFMPGPSRASSGRYSPRDNEIGKPEWSVAPSWANWLYLNIIGGWCWSHDKPGWDWFIGVWDDSDTMNQPALRYALTHGRAARKTSLEPRP